jgi:hypothetical protein
LEVEISTEQKPLPPIQLKFLLFAMGFLEENFIMKLNGDAETTGGFKMYRTENLS